MVFQLSCHSDTPTNIVRGVEVTHEWKSRDTLRLRYIVDCPAESLFIPGSAEPERMDDLWHTTCFELFLREPGAAPYYEFNFSPSSRWAAYGFTDFREGAHDLEVPLDPVIGPVDVGKSHAALQVSVTLPPDRIYPTMLAALSAIIVDADGHKTYWGYRHPEGKPEFHHADCFAARLTPPEAA